MGSTGSPTKSRLLWRLFTLLLIVHACDLLTVAQAKQISTDFQNDDTFDIDDKPAADETFERNIGQVDNYYEDMVKDELQPITAESDDNDSWFTSSLKRVRRELRKFLGSEQKDVSVNDKPKHKKRGNKPHRNRLATSTSNEPNAAQGKHQRHIQRKNNTNKNNDNKKKLPKSSARHIKRASDYDENEAEEGSGTFEDDDMLTYRTLITISEPYAQFENPADNVPFNTLHQDIERGFQQVLSADIGDNEDFEFRPTLMRVSPTDDVYKLHAIIELRLPSRIQNFEKLLRDHIERYRSIGNAGAEIDDNFYFKLVQATDPIDPEIDDDENPIPVDTGGGNNIADIPEEEEEKRRQQKEQRRQQEEQRRQQEEQRRQQKEQRRQQEEQRRQQEEQHRQQEEQRRQQKEDDERRRQQEEDDERRRQQEEDERRHQSANNNDGNGEDQRGSVSGEEESREIWDNEVRDHHINMLSNCVTNPDDLYTCNDGTQIECSEVCNYRQDCSDGIDENEKICRLLQQQRDDLEGVGSGARPPEISPDTDSSETPFAGECRGDTYFICPRSNQRICDVQRCDGLPDCPDEEDEENCPGDENPTTTNECQDYEYRCQSGLCIDNNRRCNQVPDCPDGDDEGDDCSCGNDQFRCNNGNCVPQYTTCDGHDDCQDNSDEADCTDEYPPCQPHEYRCKNGQCINQRAHCDGRTDCRDSSDERDCSSEPPRNNRPVLNLKTYPDSQTIKERREVIFRCRDEGEHRAKVRWSRPGGEPLPPGFQDKNGRLEIPNIRLEDAGIYVCEAVGYPRHEQGQQTTVHLTVEPYNMLHELIPGCKPNQATCMNGDCIDKTNICDGTPHCSDGSDEHSCSHGRKCQPNQFMCRNSKCVDRVWRCDGENDCGDNSDEETCDPLPSGAPCNYNEFQCSSGHCIPKSFQCDNLPDCIDGSDEIGCRAPEPIRPPPPRQNLREGDTLNLTCVAIGTPTPMIVWRLNWGHVPEKCKTTSHEGTGTLVCPGMVFEDSGAYSCEIINTRGTTFVNPDTLVTVNRDTNNVCPAGFFNMLARRRDECINCFCFGISSNCQSANLFVYAIEPPITSHRVVNVELSPYRDIVINESPSSSVLSLHHGVQFRASDVQYSSQGSPYLALPSEYNGKQLKSYGGNLRYEINYQGNGRQTNAPDVIITGNGFTLTHRARTQPNANNRVAVQFSPGNWNKPDGRSATREEIMMILANVDNILIRLSYIDATEREITLTNINLDSAGTTDTGLGSASLVEKCSCPPGYVGDSCESCAPGYVRQPGGPWLGRCVAYEPECAVGQYGDPRRGIPCRDCPCPLAGSQNSARGCQLSPDGDVVCNCNEGYTGRRCEYCAAGYQGNPLAPGGSCHRTPEVSCNLDGTISSHPNGTCECKPLVEGVYCDTCSPRSFFLNSFTYTGCIECFCSGITTDCGSSSLYRDQISSNFGHSRAGHGYHLVRDYDKVEATTVQFVTSANVLQFNSESTPDTLYWSLPPQFLGNKLTAYGGKLNYTLSYNPLPGGQMSRNNAPDVVIKSAEDVTLIHHRKSAVTPNTANSYAVQIIESAWQRSDGQVTNREHMLMLLSKVDAIYIKATYTTGTKDGSLVHVSLDIGSETNRGTERAWEVEECRCPEGYQGLSCERCAPGYKRNPEGGLYLGLCEPCECNGHSSQCEPESGVCLSCADNTEGENCERCVRGYVGNPSAGTPYDCQPDGSAIEQHPYPPSSDNRTECGYCNAAGTVSCDGGYCQCKPNVQGNYCDQCRRGTYSLSSRNPNGCDECYCSGQSTQCRSATLYRQLIPVDFFSNPPELTDDEGQIESTDNLDFDMARNMYTYTYKTYTTKYWSIRGPVLGNQLFSYGGQLQYQLIVDSYGGFQPGNDVILIGNGLKLLWSRPAEESDNNDYNVRLHEDEHWDRWDHGSAVPASRNDFMTVLSNLEYVLIRATPKIPVDRTSILDVILNSAVEHPSPGAEQAVEVEVCSCPSGYTGNSCESCAPLHYRDQSGNCQQCSCQAETTDRCNLDENGYVVCQCRPGYSGDRCQNIDDNTPEPPSNQRPDFDYRTQITVSITPPEITIIPVGGSLTLSCSGRLTYDNRPVVVSWYKLDGQLPSETETDGGVLYLYNLQVSDSGVYICQALSNDTTHIFEDKVSITISESTQRSPAQIINLPQYVTFEEYQPNAVDCEISGNPTPTVTWTRVDGQMSRDARTEGTRLIFDAPRKSDEGNYRCEANNGYGNDEKYTQIYVRPTVPQPPQPPRRVYIVPDSFNGEAGENVQLSCQPTTSISLTYDWLKNNSPLQGQRNVILSGNVLEIRDASPRDSGTYTCIGIDNRGRQNYTANAQVYIEEPNSPYPEPPQSGIGGKPIITPLPEQRIVQQGEDFSITCEANGTPYPSIKWTKVHESLAINVQQTGNVLRIVNAKPENRGIYLCVAENSNGYAQANVFVEVEPREPPTVEISLSSADAITVGWRAGLYCSAQGIPSPTLQWRRVDGRPLSPRHQEDSPGNLIIYDIKLEDAGDYECVAENSVGRQSATTSLRVIKAPIVQIEPDLPDVRFTEGDEVHLVCSASGFPHPSVRWVKEGQPESIAPARELTHNQAFLDINRVSLSDADSYKCIAQNEAGTDERTITVDVVQKRGDIGPDDGDVERDPNERDPNERDPNERAPYRPYPGNLEPYDPYNQPQQPQQPPARRPAPQSNTLGTSLGEDVRLECDLPDQYGNTIWERVDGEQLPPNAQINRNVLEIRRVVEENLGEYRCNAYDNRGTLLTYIIRELVLIPLPRITFHPPMPLVVNANDNINILCHVDGAQPIQQYWTTDNNRPLPSSVISDGKYLRFPAITPADAGSYLCVASNAYGNQSLTAKVVVRHPNTYHQLPQAQRHDRNQGEDIQLTCNLQDAREQITGDIHYEWRRDDGQQLPLNSVVRNQVLYLYSVRPEDAGRYICESYTSSGTRSAPSYVDLNINRIPTQMRPAYIPPPAPVAPEPTQPRDLSLKLDQQSSNLPVGGSTEVECYSSDESYTDVIWERADGAPLSQNIQQIGNRLVITHVAASDAGNYVCKCKTDEGDLYTTSYELAIEESPHELKRPKIVHAQVGSSAQLRCGADDSRRSTYRWSRQYGQLQPGRDILSDLLTLQDVQASDAGTYICTVLSPDDGETVDYPTILVVTGAIPHFHQTPLSYMSFPALPDSTIRFNLELTFRPESDDGLLLFNGQKRGGGYYIALSLRDGYPEFHYDIDGKPAVITAEQPLTLNEWHTVRVNRFRRDGYMQVDEQHPVAFPTLAANPNLDLIEDLYVGGVPSWDLLPANAVETQAGFVGCVSRLTLQGSTLELMKDAKFKVGVTSCQPCASQPCTNGGICLESQSEQAYTCICQQGWTGRNCAVEGAQCTPGICGTGRCENTELGFECICPLNRTGDRCQYVEHLNEHSLNFKKNSYAAYPTPRSSRINIKFAVRPNSLDDAVLLYTAESKLPSGDFIAVILRDGHVELLINTGARLKPVQVRSLNALPLNKWTDIEISRRLGEGILRVGDEPEQRAKAKTSGRTLYIKTPLYIGGYDRINVKPNRLVNITNGFDGCISKLQDAQRQVNLIADIIDAANIQNCGEINEVDDNENFEHIDNSNVYQPNANEETQQSSSNIDTSDRFIQPLDPCANEPCENGGTCSLGNDAQIVCSCPIGFTGRHCDEHISISFNATFQGNGYLELNRNQFSDKIEQEYTSAVVVFSTTKPNGLLLWWGQPKDVEFSGQDFIALAIVDGYVEYSVRLNGEEAVIRSVNKRVDDGGRHIAIIKRSENTALLELDHNLDSGETRPTAKTEISLPGNVFIGGIPNIAQFTGGRYTHNFNGCIHFVEGEAVGQVNLGTAAISGINLDTCPTQDDGREGTEPPVV